MTPRHVRALRGAAAAWIATVVAATSHTLAGGGAPSPALVAVLGILASPLAIALAGRRLSAWRIGVTVLASQALFHGAFAVTADVDPSVAAIAHAHHATLLGAPDPVGGLLPDAPMLVGHVLAAAATMLALYCGERMLRALGRGIRSILRRAGEPAPAPIVLLRIAAGAPPTLPARGVVLSDVSRRGPPALVDAAL